MSISAQWLYNALQKEVQQVILIDCRDYCEYEGSHIATAVCMPPAMGLNADGEEDFVDLTELDTSYFKHPDHFPYYEDRGLKYLVVYNNNDHNMWIGHVISCMDVEGVVKNVQALEEGFQEFHARYPFMTTTKLNPKSLFSLEGFPFPIELEYKQMYISVSTNEVKEEHIENLKITTILYVGDIAPVLPPTSTVDCQQLTSAIPFTDSFTTEFIQKVETLAEEKRIVLLHASEAQDSLSLAVLFLMTKNTNFRNAYHLAIQSYWQDGHTLSQSHLTWLSQAEVKLRGTKSVEVAELLSGNITEVPVSKICSIQ